MLHVAGPLPEIIQKIHSYLHKKISFDIFYFIASVSPAEAGAEGAVTGR
jgi:hypothetical protein